MTYQSLIKPKLDSVALPGLCLVMAQNITGAPVAHPSATAGANATKYRHATRVMPNAVCVVWFDHVGTYGDPPERKNWGHVVVYVPGKGFASSSPIPGNRPAPIFWYKTIADVESTFNAKFRFWTEDINTLRVCSPVAAPAESEDDDMGYYVETSTQGGKWFVSFRTGKRRLCGKAEWSRIRSSGVPITLKRISESAMNAIPKA